MTTSADKIAGAPISWGVCEVPGWGYQLSPERVLTEMQQVGLAATEFGPDGFLPADLAVMAEFLASRHLTAVGGFTPVVLHEAGHSFGFADQTSDPTSVMYAQYTGVRTGLSPTDVSLVQSLYGARRPDSFEGPLGNDTFATAATVNLPYIGADITNLDKVRGLGAPVASIGGAGTFDGIFLTGILAVLLASLYARPRQAETNRG